MADLIGSAWAVDEVLHHAAVQKVAGGAKGAGSQAGHQMMAAASQTGRWMQLTAA